MSIDVTSATADADDWDDLVARSPHATPYHLDGTLDVLADHSGMRAHRLVGYKGQEPVGLFPVFEGRKGPVRFVSSPPPDLKVDYLGPVLLDPDGLKRRKRDKRHLRFLEACLDWIDTEVEPKYTSIRTGFRYDDPRPFVWNDFEVTTKYTYAIDLSPGADALFDEFSADARRNVRDARALEDGVDVSVGDADDAARIAEQLAERLADKGEEHSVSPGFVRDLHERLPNGVFRPYVCRLDGTFYGGLLTFETDGTVYAWQGGAKTEGRLNLNDYLDWQIIRDAIERGNHTYDLVGAESPRLCWYKAKFAPDLRPYHVATKGSVGTTALSKLYRRVR